MLIRFSETILGLLITISTVSPILLFVNLLLLTMLTILMLPNSKPWLLLVRMVDVFVAVVVVGAVTLEAGWK